MNQLFDSLYKPLVDLPLYQNGNPNIPGLNPIAENKASSFTGTTNSVNTFGSDVNAQKNSATGVTTNPFANAAEGAIPGSTSTYNGTSSSSSNIQSAGTSLNDGNTNSGSASPDYALGLIKPKTPEASPSQGGVTSDQGGSSPLSGAAQQIGTSAVKSSGIFDGITTAINNFGGSLGFASQIGGAAESYGPSAAGAAEAFGPAAQGNVAGALGTSATLSSILGSAGIGYFAGGLLNSFIGGNQQNGSIGGSLGAAAGTFFGGPIGGVIGGTIGSVVGGLFGPGKPTTASQFSGSHVGADGTITGTMYGSKGASDETATNMNKAFGNLTSAASTKLGVQFNPSYYINGGFNSLHSPTGESKPGFLVIVKPDGTGDFFGFDPKDSKSVTTAYYDTISKLASYSGYTDTQKLYDWFYGQQTPTTGTSSTVKPITIAPRKTA